MMRYSLIIILMLVYVLIGLHDSINDRNLLTGISAFLLAIVNGLMFFAGGK